MDKNTTVEGFINSLGIEYSARVLTTVINQEKKKKQVCVLVSATYKEKKVYQIVDCFARKKDGTIEYLESEPYIHPKDGVFSYLGDDNAVDNFFLDVSTLVAEKWFEYL